MNVENQFGDESVAVREVETDHGTEAVVDFGPGTDASVDVVGNTAIIVLDSEQYEITVTEGAQAFMSNGVLTIEVNE